MQKLLTDVHNHSTFSVDGIDPLSQMLKTACEKGLAFYGVSEHADYDTWVKNGALDIDFDEYFHAARHLQEDYAGVMNVLIGVEMGYTISAKGHTVYEDIQKKYRPDFVINSVHGMKGEDYYYLKPFQDLKGRQKTKAEAYGEYLALVRSSLDAPYSYDIVGHMGYLTRYAPYEDNRLTLKEYGKEIDDILRTIIKKGKILEINSSNVDGEEPHLPSREIVQRYYDLGGRNVSYGSDAHDCKRVADGRECVMKMLKDIGFTYLSVPCQGEYIKVEI